MKILRYPEDRVVRCGRGTAHLECDLEDGEGRLVARATSVCAMRQPKGLP